jgi:hypothetical protein
MADYYPLISRAVAGLEKNNGENRRALYDRARAALLAQLRGVTPALPETDITRERLALEESIRKVEAESARQFDAARSQAQPKARAPEPDRFEETRPAAREEAPRPTAPRPAPPRPRVPEPERWEKAPRAPAAAPPAANPAPARRPAPAAAPPMLGEMRYSDTVFDQPMEGRPEPPPAPRHPLRGPPAERRPAPDTGFNDFRSVVSEANELGGASARATKSARDAYAAVPSESSEYDRREARARDLDELHEEPAPRDDFPQPMLEPSVGLDEARPLPARTRHAPPPPLDADEDLERGEVAPRRRFAELVKGLVALLVIVGIGGVLWWQWPNLVSAYRALRPSAVETAKDAPAPSPKKTQERVESGPTTQPPPAVGTGAAVAQKVVLYEEDPANPDGKRFVGSAVWRTETVTPGPNQPPELAIRADVEVPERKLSMTFTLRRDSAQQKVTSHTIEIMFKVPADFPAGSISNVPGILMKQSESMRGVPLSGHAVKVTAGYFLIGLSAADSDRERNIAMLKERSWFDIPLVYANNRRAIMAIEKGTPGDNVFAEAFKAWRQ